MRDLPELSQTIHLIGIGGIGVSGVAHALVSLGYTVTGSDVRESQLTLGLRERGVKISLEQRAENIEGVDLVVVSTAIPATNPELVAAHEKGLAVWHRSELLGALLGGHETSIGVIGTHGKGTTASAITWILEEAGLKPSFIIGGLLENFGKINTRYEAGSHLVAEVDESDGSLRNIYPTVAVINNLEADHLNYYEDLEHVQRTVVEALNANKRLKKVIINADDPGAMEIAAQLKAPILTFGRNEGAAVRGVDAEASFEEGRYQLQYEGQSADVVVSMPGMHNLDNSLAAAATALYLGVEPGAIVRALSGFKGLENRFTVVQAEDKTIVKDYISHPTGIRRVLEAAATSGRQTVAVFKPYRFTMINYLQDDYAEAFHDADHTIITELYPAGEVPIPGIDTEFLCDKIRARGPRVTYVPEMDAIIDHLLREVPEQAQVIFFGGDDLFEIADAYAARLREVGQA